MSIRLPHVIMPGEFVSLLKQDLPRVDSPEIIFKNLRSNLALFSILENVFKEFDDGRGHERLMMSLGWPNYKERVASVFISKAIYGKYPTRTNMELVHDIRLLENRFNEQTIQSHSRLFLLGFYIKLANLSFKDSRQDSELIQVPVEVDALIKLSQGRSDRIDLIILIVMHLTNFLGFKKIFELLCQGLLFDDIYSQLSNEQSKMMHHNLLAYSASIFELDLFYSEKV